jgi:hypothetical protein
MTSMSAFREAAIAWAVRGNEEARALASTLGTGIAAAILVEGVSDAAAVDALAVLHQRDLGREGVCVIPMGGVTNVAKFLRVLGPSGLGLRLAGLCDLDRELHFRRALEREGLREEGMEAAGFFVCVEDLEDELIRALGAERVQQVLEAEGDLRAFRTFQNQPAQRDRAIERQLRRFLGTIGGRKERYGRALVAALDPALPPEPLDRVLRFVS